MSIKNNHPIYTTLENDSAKNHFKLFDGVCTTVVTAIS